MDTTIFWLKQNKDAIESLGNIITFIAVILGGIWAVNQFTIKREFASQVEFTAGIEFIGVHTDYWIIEIIAMVNNKGGSHLKMHEFIFKLRSIENENLEIGEKKVNFQTVFLVN